MINDTYLRLVPQYCERVGNSIFSEPINLLSNLAFFITVILLYKEYKNIKKVNFEYWFILITFLVVGIGSSLWHSLRSPLGFTLDSVPILIFLLSLFFVILKELTTDYKKAIILTTFFLSLQFILSYLFSNFLNGSVLHVTSGVIFFSIIIWIRKKYSRILKNIVIGLLLYILAIIFRSIDNLVCPYFPLGTHFMWHILNAGGAYFAVKGLFDLRSLSIKNSY